jgi:hypothetical protein
LVGFGNVGSCFINPYKVERERFERTVNSRIERQLVFGVGASVIGTCRCSDERTVPRDYEHRLQAAASKKKLSLRLLPLGLKGELSLGTVAARHHAQDWVAVPDDLGTVPANLGSVAPT